MRPVLLLAFVLSLVLSQVSPAFAQADKPTGLLILKVDGEQLGEAEKSAVAKNLKAELEKYKKYALSEAPDLDLLEAMVEFECLDIDAACLASIASKKDVQQVLYVKVDGGAAQLVLVCALCWHRVVDQAEWGTDCHVGCAFSQ